MMPSEVVFLLDVDNTLHDTDRFIADLDLRITELSGPEGATRYWALFEELRATLGYADYLGAVQRCRDDPAFGPAGDQRVMALSHFVLDYPYAERLYPGALDVLRRLSGFGRTVLLTDGDAVLQPHKLRRAGLWDAVEGRVLIYIHKEQMVDMMQRQYPAERYVLVDDKLRLLTAMKAQLGRRLTAVFPRQGHYALDTAAIASLPPADIAIERIAELLTLDMARLLQPPAQTDAPVPPTPPMPLP